MPEQIEKKVKHNGDFFPSTSLDDFVDTGMRRLYFETDGVRYEWHGGIGAQFLSIERGVRYMETRKILGVWFYAYRSESDAYRWPWRLFLRGRVSWACCNKLEIEQVRQLRKLLFL